MTPARLTAVITGGNTGIGKETARSLAVSGYRVIITSRNPLKAAAAVADIASQATSSGAEVHPGGAHLGHSAGAAFDVQSIALDLASLESVRTCAAELLDRCERIDVLVANAGAIMSPRSETTDGFEATFGVNHLGHFALVNLLAERMKASAPSRIVVVSSAAHRSSRGLRFDDLQRTRRRYSAWGAYCDSKLANVLHARELADRLKGTGVVVHSLHPGFVDSEFGSGSDVRGLMRRLVNLSKRGFAMSTMDGAATSVHVATSAEAAQTTGLYWEKSSIAKPSKRGLDDHAARRLWEVSEALVSRTR